MTRKTSQSNRLCHVIFQVTKYIKITYFEFNLEEFVDLEMLGLKLISQLSDYASG